MPHIMQKETPDDAKSGRVYSGEDLKSYLIVINVFQGIASVLASG